MRKYLTMSASLTVKRAEERGYRVKIFSVAKNMFAIANDTREVIFKGVCLGNALGMSKISNDKSLMNLLLEYWEYPVVSSVVFLKSEMAAAKLSIIENEKSVFLKPLSGAHGHGVSLWKNTDSHEVLQDVIDNALDFSKKTQNFIVQDFVEGEDYRFLVLFGKCMCVSHRIKPSVVGDGVHTIEELVDTVNLEEFRSAEMYKSTLTTVKFTEEFDEVLAKQDCKRDTVPALGKKILLSYKCNTSSGGTERLIEGISPVLIAEVEALAAKIDLEFIAIDVLHDRLEDCTSLFDTKILELNSCPGLFTPSTEVNNAIIDRILDRKLEEIRN